MKVSVPLAAAAALLVSSAAFAAGASPATAPNATKPVKPHAAAVHHHAKAMAGEADATTALNLLEAQGYYGFTNFQRTGQNYTATVTQNGKTFQVTVDPRTRQVTRG